MNRTWKVAVLILALVPVAGCSLYLGGDDDDCEPWGVGSPQELRNPETGACEAFGGGGWGCDDTPVATADIAAPDWGYCYNQCTGLDEGSCQDAPGCRAVYAGDCPEGLDCFATTYYYAECWDTAPSGPIQGGGCYGLDAQECSRHDDCVAHHYPGPEPECPPNADCDIAWPQPANFEACAPESTNPDGSCYEQTACDAAPPACPAGTVPGVANGCYTGACIAYQACEPPLDPGACWEQVECLAFAIPECPEGSVPGVKDGCWSGYCIPEEQCEPEPVACDQVTTEVSCIDRADCAPIYQGLDCTCDQNGNCTCADWSFEACQAATAAVYRIWR